MVPPVVMKGVISELKRFENEPHYFATKNEDWILHLKKEIQRCIVLCILSIVIIVLVFRKSQKYIGTNS
jgi:hypothetical protein